MSRVVAFSVAVVVVVGVLAGCSAAAKEPVGLNASRSPSATPTATATPKAGTGVVKELSDPALGIVFEAVPAVHGDAADVYNWIATFEKEDWRTTTTNQVSPMFSYMASAEVQTQAQSSVDNNLQKGNHFGGVIHERVGGISIDGYTARGTSCEDYAKVTFANAAKTSTPAEAGYGQPHLVELTLARVSAENGWKVMTIKENGTC